jgi:sulfur carrier protein ThiS
LPRVDVELVGPIRRPWREQKRTVDVPDGTSVADLLADLGYSSTESEHMSVLVNAERTRSSTRLGEGDQIVITVIVGGG